MSTDEDDIARRLSGPARVVKNDDRITKLLQGIAPDTRRLEPMAESCGITAQRVIHELIKEGWMLDGDFAISGDHVKVRMRNITAGETKTLVVTDEDAASVPVPALVQRFKAD